MLATSSLTAPLYCAHDALSNSAGRTLMSKAL